jgi:hypothetical protein
MTIEEAIEWCVIHRASVEFTEFYSADSKDFELLVMVTPACRPGVKHIGSPNTEGIISAVQHAQRAIWGDWKYREFTRPERLPVEAIETASHGASESVS